MKCKDCEYLKEHPEYSICRLDYEILRNIDTEIECDKPNYIEEE